MKYVQAYSDASTEVKIHFHAPVSSLPRLTRWQSHRLALDWRWCVKKRWVFPTDEALCEKIGLAICAKPKTFVEEAGIYQHPANSLAPEWARFQANYEAPHRQLNVLTSKLCTSHQFLYALRAYDEKHGTDTFEEEIEALLSTHTFMDGNWTLNVIPLLNKDIESYT